MRGVVDRTREWMIEANHASRSREFLGVITIGQGGGDFSFNWKGWVEVADEKEEVSNFKKGMSYAEALKDRGIRDAEVAKRGFRAQWDSGGFSWGRSD